MAIVATARSSIENDTRAVPDAKRSVITAVDAARLPIIHVGYPKAGSSSLQANLFFENPEISYLSGNRPAGAGTALQRSPDTPKFYRAIHNVKDQFDRETLLAEWSRHFEPWIASDKTNLLSSEGFTMNHVPPGEVAKRLKLLFPKARILVILRNQTDLLRSLYDMHPYRIWRGQRRVIPTTTWLTDIVADAKVSVAGGLFYSGVLAEYQRLFGAENVAAFLFERLFKEESEMRRIAEFLYIDPRETVLRMRQQPKNRSNDHSFARLGRRLLGPVHASWVLPFGLIRKITAFGARAFPAKRSEFSERERAELRAVYGADNVATAQLIRQDLGAYGYPMP